MAVDRLPVYNKTRQLFLQFELSTKKAPIDIKRGIISDTKSEIIRILEHLSFADEMVNSVEARMVFIEDAIRTMRSVKVRVRILFDLHYIKKSGFAALIALEEDVFRQLQGWLNKTEQELETR